MEPGSELSEIIERYLYSDIEDPLHPETVSLQLTRRQMRFLLMAITAFREQSCPLEGRGNECPLIGTAESVHTGALELKCLLPCDEWARFLAREVVRGVYARRPWQPAP